MPIETRTVECLLMSEPAQNVATILKESSLGSEDAAAQLDSALYGELRRLAEAAMRGERREHTLQPTALVHEAFLRPAHESCDYFSSCAMQWMPPIGMGLCTAI